MMHGDFIVSGVLLYVNKHPSLHPYTPQPPMSSSRLDIIGKAFLRLDKTGDGQITIDDLRG